MKNEEQLNELALKELKFNHKNVQEKHEIGFRLGFVQGYELAQQELFTVEDLKEAITFGYVIGHSHGMNNKDIERPLEGKDFEEFIQSLKDGKNEKST